MRGPDSWSTALRFAVVLGMLFRLGQYAAQTSLWHDEAYVALNVIQKSYAGLLGPLDWQEAAPPGFLWVEKLVIESLGRSEYALRLVPLVAGQPPPNQHLLEHRSGRRTRLLTIEEHGAVAYLFGADGARSES